MNVTAIVAELRAERVRLDRAISALESISANGAHRSTKTKAARSRVSASGRKRLSELLKKRWADGKMSDRNKRRANEKALVNTAGATRRGGRRMSAAARKRLSELMKKRWAAGKMKRKSLARAA